MSCKLCNVVRTYLPDQIRARLAAHEARTAARKALDTHVVKPFGMPPEYYRDKK